MPARKSNAVDEQLHSPGEYAHILLDANLFDTSGTPRYKHMNRTLLLWILLGAHGVGCDTKRETAEMVFAEGQAASEDLAVSNGNIILKTQQPGVAFAFVTKPQEAKEFAYFAIFNHDFPNGKVGTHSSSDGFAAETHHSLQAFGNECMIQYSLTLAEDGKTVTAETLGVEGVDYDAANGKVFLIDMRATPPQTVQLDLALPRSIPSLKSPQQTDEFGTNILQGLRTANRQVDAFCSAIDEAPPTSGKN